MLLAQPADDGHTAIISLVSDEDLAAQVVIKVDFIPRHRHEGEALLGRLDPDCVRELGQKLCGPSGVVVQEEDSSMVENQ